MSNTLFPPKVLDSASIGIINQSAESFVKNAVKLRITITADEKEYLERCFAPRIVISSNKTTGGGHPIAAALLEYANNSSDTIRCPTTTEIGPGVGCKQVWANGHSCWSTGDARDNARHSNNVHKLSTFSDKNAVAFLNEITRAQGEPTTCNGRVCYAGIQRCNAKASTILSVHSSYDIDFEDWPRIFRATGATKAVIWMFLPAELVDQRFRPDRFYKFKADGGKALFYFPGDTSFGYVHSYSNWRKYLMRSTARDKDVLLIFEIVNWFGPMAKIHVTRTSGNVQLVRTIVPRSENYVAVPDVVDWLANGYHDRSRDILVEREPCEAICSFAMRQPAHGFETKNILSFAIGRTYRIRIGNVIRNCAWDIDHRDLYEVVNRLCHIAVMRRDESAKSMAYISTAIKTGEVHSKPSWWRHLPAFILAIVGSRIRSIPWLPKLLASMLSVTFGVASCLLFYLRSSRFSKSDAPPRAVDVIGNGVYKANYTDVNEYAISTDSSAIGEIGSRDLLGNIVYVSDFLIPPSVCTGGPEVNEEAAVNSDAEVHVVKRVGGPELDSLRKRVVEFVDAMKKSSIPVARSNGRMVAANLTLEVEREIKMRAIMGGPGTGKSHSLEPGTATKSVVVISPMRALAEDFRSKDFDAYTLDVGLKAALQADTVVIDEAFLIHASYLAVIYLLGQCSEIVLLGDPKQINFIDFEVAYPSKDNCGVFLPYCEIENRDCSYRCPHDVVNVLNANFGYKLKTKSKVRDSIEFGKPKEKVDKVLVFTQNAKRTYTGSDTVHAMQGQTFSVVHLILTTDATSLLNTSNSHFVVGLSRHTRKVYIEYAMDVEDIPSLNVQFVLSPSMLRTLEHVAGVILHDQDTQSDPVLQLVDIPEPSLVQPMLTSPDAVDHVLDMIALGHVANEEFYDSTIKPCNREILVKEWVTDEVPIEEWRMRGNLYDHNTRPQNKIMVLRTMAERYATVTSQMSDVQAEVAAQDMFERFTHCYIEKYNPYDGETENEAFLANIQAQVKKNTAGKVQDFDTDPYLAEVQFFMKAQSKVKMAPNVYNLSGAYKGKVGQGVSAWSKTLNCVFGGHVRASAAALKSSLYNTVNVVGGMAEARDLMVTQNMDGEKFYSAETDLTEFDTMQNKVTITFECKVMHALGVPFSVLALYYVMRMNWRLNMPGFMSLIVVAMKASGEPATLSGNTTTAMGIGAVVYEIEPGITIVFGKGDDLLFLSRKPLTVRRGALEVLGINCAGLEIKEVINSVPQFVGYFLTPAGPVADLARLAAKVKSKPLKVGISKIRESRFVAVITSQNNSFVSTDPTHVRHINIIDEGGFVNPMRLAKYMMSVEDRVIHINLHLVPNNNGVFAYLARMMGKKLILHLYDADVKIACTEFQTSVRSRLKLFHDTALKVEYAVKCTAAYHQIPEKSVRSLLDWLSTFGDMRVYHAIQYYEKIRHNEIPVSSSLDCTTAKPDKGTRTIRFDDAGSNGHDCFDRAAAMVGLDINYIDEVRKVTGDGNWVEVFDVISVAYRMGVSIGVYVGIGLNNTADVGGSDIIIINWVGDDIGPQVLLHNGHWYAINVHGEQEYTSVFLARTAEQYIGAILPSDSTRIHAKPSAFQQTIEDVQTKKTDEEAKARARPMETA